MCGSGVAKFSKKEDRDPPGKSQASLKFASLTMQVPRSKKDLVVSVEQQIPVVKNENSNIGDAALVGVGVLIGITLVSKYSTQLSKPVKHWLKTWFGIG